MWREALQVLLLSSSARKESAATSSVVAGAAAEQVAAWLTAHKLSHPVLASRIAAAISPTAAPPVPVADELRKAIVSVATSPHAPAQQTQEIVSGLVNVASVSTTSENLALLAALSRSQSLDPRRTSLSRLPESANNIASSSSVAAATLFSSLSSSTSASSAVKSAAEALFVRCVAPMFMRASLSSSAAAAASSSSLESAMLLLSPEHRAFLEAARNCSLRKEKKRHEDADTAALAALKVAFDQLPEKRPLNAVYVRCLIDHHRWDTALSLLQSSSSPSSQSSSSASSFQLNSALAGLHTVAGNWEAALKLVSPDSSSSTGTGFAGASRLATIYRITRLAAKNSQSSSSNGCPKEFLDALRHLADKATEGLDSTSPHVKAEADDEATTSRAGAAHALAITLSSNWQQALRDFSMSTFLASPGGARREGGEGDPAAAAIAVARAALEFDKPVRRRVLRAAAEGNRVDVLKTALRLLAPSQSSPSSSSSSSSSSSIFTVSETRSLCRSIAVHQRNPALLAKLRDAWPDDASATTALLFEANLAAKQLVVMNNMQRKKRVGRNNKSSSSIRLPFNQSTEAARRGRRGGDEDEEVRFQHLARHFLNSAAMCCALLGTSRMRKVGGGGLRLALFQVGTRVLAEHVDFASFIAPFSAVSSTLRAGLNDLNDMFMHEKTLRERRSAVLLRARITKNSDNRSSSSSNLSSSSRQRQELLLMDLCKAKFPLHSYSKTMRLIESALAAQSLQSTVAPAAAVESPSSSWSFDWNLLADELVRVGKKRAPDLLRVVRHVVPLIASPSPSSAASPSSSSSVDVCTGLMRVLAQRKPAPPELPQRNRRQRLLTKSGAETLGCCVVGILSAAPLDVLHHHLRLPSLKSQQQRQQKQPLFVSALVRTTPFPASPPAPEARARILSAAQQEMAAAAPAAPGFLLSTTADVVVNHGWVRGADDVLQLASASSVAAESGGRGERDAEVQYEQLVLWLLQQSAECRGFVRDETRRIAAERRGRNLSMLAPQTIQAELWRQLRRMFTAAAAALSPESSSSSSITIAHFVQACATLLKEENMAGDDTAADNDDHGDDDEKEKEKRNGVAPFCFRNAIAKNEVANSRAFQATFVANSCHIEDERVRGELVKLLREHCGGAKAKRKEKCGGSLDASLAVGSECLWERWVLLATAEGVEKLICQS